MNTTFQQPHDQFAKQFLSELLEPLLGAEVKVNYEVHAESHYVDIYFSPKTAPLDSKLLETLGLLGRIVSHACLLEPFRSPVNQEDVRNCILKLIDVSGKIREHQKKQQKLEIQESEVQESTVPEEIPDLWILSTSVSDGLLSSFGAKTKPEWGNGVYFLAKALNTRIIAINRLPKTPQTLYLRMLGKGNFQKQAIEEFLAWLPKNSPLRQYTLKMLFMYRIYLKGKTDLTEDEKELFMNLSQTYITWEKETLQKGLLEGQRML
jgi:hypothetical protein